MILETNYKQWGEAHIFYNVHNYKSVSSSKNAVEEYNWMKKISNSPNGQLFEKNCFFNSLCTSNKIYLAHITYNLKEILNCGYIYSSGGCLVGSIYCIPLTKSENGLRMHNLGSYIYTKEAPLASKIRKKPDIVLFEIEIPFSSKNLIGIDYLKLGNNHFNIYKSLEYLLSSRERFDLQEIILTRIKRSIEYLSTSNYYYHTNYRDIDYSEFLNLFIKTIDELPILGYFYFEVISEYLMLFQDGKDATKYNKLGEFYNPSYKNLMFKLYPSLAGNFKLNLFKPSFKTLCKYIEDNRLFKIFNAKQMLKYLCEKLIFLSTARLINNVEKATSWGNLQWNFDSLLEIAQPLVGHIIHRELRTFDRYPDFYFYFDQIKALQVWNYWNHMDIAIPFSGLIPKGEVGINPAYPNLKYKVFKSDVYKKDNDCFISPKNEINIKIAPKLVNLKSSFMRKPNFDCLKHSD